MGLLKGAIKAGIAKKAIDAASRPENQRKAKSLLGRLTNRGGSKRPR